MIVLRSLAVHLYSVSFLDELERPQTLFSLASTRKIYEKMIGLTNVRLTEHGMDKV